MMSPFFTCELKSTLIFTTFPETTEPTATVMTGLMVPVACTTCETSPFSTLAVKYCALERWPTDTYPAQRSNTTGGATTNARCSMDRCQTSFAFARIGRMRGLQTCPVCLSYILDASVGFECCSSLSFPASWFARSRRRELNQRSADEV